jgi:hypothetical protein
MVMRLNGPTQGRFIRAMEESFDDSDLRMILRERFGLKYNKLTNPTRDWSDQVIEVHDYFDFRYRTDELVAALRDYRPQVPELVEIADSIGFTAVSKVGLEVLVQHKDSPYQDVETFRAKLATVEAAICQVDADGSLGTGTLIAPDIVITNRHVVRNKLDDQDELTGKILCRFDFKSNGRGATTPVVEVGVTAVLASRRHAPEDLVAGPMTADPDALDYVLLKLERKLGDEPVIPGGEERGHVDVAAPPETGVDAGVLVVQHPNGQPMKIDIGSVTALGQVRLRHTVNTEPGSSGAPVLDAALRMVAIHQAGQANGPGAGLAYNSGIPLRPILADARLRQSEV